MYVQLNQNKPLGARDIHVTIQEAELESATSLFVGDVDVMHADGRYTRFFVYVRENNRGQAQIEVSTNTPSGTSTRKLLTGHKRERRD